MAVPLDGVATAPTSSSPLLTVALVVAGLGAGLVAGLALAALARRRTTPYLLVALAVLAVLGRAVVGGLSLQGLLDPDVHHLAEHLLDVVMIALVVAAVLLARRTGRSA